MHDLSFVVHRAVRIADGARQVQDYHRHAQHGYYAEEENLFRLEGAARIDSSSGKLTADRIEATFTSRNTQVESLICQGNAVYQSQGLDEGRTLQGDRIAFGIDKQSHAIESIYVRENARFSLKSESGTKT